MYLKQLFFNFILVFIILPTFTAFAQIDQEMLKENELYNNNSVIEWNDLTYKTADEHDHFYSFIGVRTLAMVHIAIHDALNSINPKYETYSYKGNEPGANPIAAISQAAYEVLIKVFPDKKNNFDTELNKWLNKIPEGKNKKLGIELGKKSAMAIMNLRRGDGYDAEGDYTPGNNPGDYQYTPGFDWVWSPDFRFAKPFSMTSPDQFRSPPPPKLNSREYTSSYNEVKKFGIKNSKFRNEDQTSYAHWWAEFAEHGWNRIGRLTADNNKLPLWETARMFALMDLDIFDIYLASFDSKYFYNTWRPITAIQKGDTDGNPNTEADTKWESEMPAPPFPEYPSAHASVSAGGAEIVTQVYGTPDVSFTMESTSALPNFKARTYDNLNIAVEHCADSRIMNGFHFRFSVEEGKIMGRNIAKNLINNFLRPLNHLVKSVR